MQKSLWSGNEGVAHAARDCAAALGAGYPGTPSTEILEVFSSLGGNAEWAPNEKVALEVALGAAFGGARALSTMKHVGLNVAADPFFSAAYTGVSGALVVVSADDPGLASSQNEQDNRNYARAAGVPMLEPSDSQDAYDLTVAAFELSERHKLPVLLRMTTRVCHSKSVVLRGAPPLAPPPEPRFERDIRGRVMIPANAAAAHKRLRRKLEAVREEFERSALNRELPGGRRLGVIASGVSFAHAREAAPEAGFFKLATTWPLPLEALRRFAEKHEKCAVIEEGDPFLEESLKAAGINVRGRPPEFRFGELNVGRVRRILSGDTSPEPEPRKGTPPQLCAGCPHRSVFSVLAELGCIVAGDIGCYTLGALPPFEAMDSCVCMGAAITVGLGLRHVLPEAQARKVVSVIGDSTFVHSGIAGLVEMSYNRPKYGHIVLILDNGTTAMTGLQDHPGTGVRLDRGPAHQLDYEKLAKSLGIENVHVMDPFREPEQFKKLLVESMAGGGLTVIIARRPCILALKKRMRPSGKEPKPNEG